MKKSNYLFLVILVFNIVSIAIETNLLHAEKNNHITRKPVLAGTWYATDSVQLKKDNNTYLNKVNLKKTKDLEQQRIVGMIAPHAGHMWSGQTTAYGFLAVKAKDIKRIIMGPSHYVDFYGIAVSKVPYYKTPLGLIPVDQNICQKLIEFSQSETVPLFHHEPRPKGKNTR